MTSYGSASWTLEESRSSFAGQITHIHEIAPRAAVYGKASRSMHPAIESRLAEKGLDQMYSHQAAAFDLAGEGKDLVVVTGTNSGKTLCFNLPVIQALLTEPAAKALYLFPTKALAQDQLGKLEQLLAGTSIYAGVYDGDTPQNRRASMRKSAHIVLTNPDMLHVGILPSHELWATFLKSLRVIVIDEMHVYRGVFGSHVAGVLRRLLRLCDWKHSKPQIIACSATIGNPKELFQQLTDRRATLISEDGAPRAKRTFYFWNPPMIGDQQRLSANATTAEIVASLVENDQRTIAFCRSRVTAELILRQTRDRLSKTSEDLADKVDSYRAGYTPKERRQIEQALFKGRLLGLASTNAMELGVDIGGLDAVVMNGYPGSIASFWQQAGRAGRGTREGIAVMVAHDDSLEQFLIREPHRLLEASNENVSINPQNATIMSSHLKCAAFERPISPTELENFGDKALEAAEALDRTGELSFQSGRFYYPSHEAPAPKVNIRGSDNREITLFVNDQPLGSMEYWRAMGSAHEGAVYLHRSQSYLVESLDLERHRADLRPCAVDYYTVPMSQSVIELQVDIAARDNRQFKMSLCGIRVTEAVIAYKRKALDGGAVLGVFDLDMPANTYETIATRLDLANPESEDDYTEFMGAIHGLEHALLAVAPLTAGCDRNDLGSAWYSIFPDTARPAVFVFDKVPGGVGLVENLFSHQGSWFSAAYQLLASCSCLDGCPGCLLSARCEAGNELLNKRGAIDLIRMLSQSAVD